MGLQKMEQLSIFDSALMVVIALGVCGLFAGFILGKPILGVFAALWIAGISYSIIALYRNEYLGNEKQK